MLSERVKIHVSPTAPHTGPITIKSRGKSSVNKASFSIQIQMPPTMIMKPTAVQIFKNRVILPFYHYPTVVRTQNSLS